MERTSQRFLWSVGEQERNLHPGPHWKGPCVHALGQRITAHKPGVLGIRCPQEESRKQTSINLERSGAHKITGLSPFPLESRSIRSEVGSEAKCGQGREGRDRCVFSDNTTPVEGPPLPLAHLPRLASLLGHKTVSPGFAVRRLLKSFRGCTICQEAFHTRQESRGRL